MHAWLIDYLLTMLDVEIVHYTNTVIEVKELNLKLKLNEIDIYF